MTEKNTGDLRQELMSQPDLDSYLRENRAFFAEQDFTRLLMKLFRRLGLSKAELARRAEISEVYLHQVFSRRRNPSRNRLICICAGLEATLEETQEVLKRAGYAQLYPRSRRDAIISHGLLHGAGLPAINEKLREEGENTLL